MWSLREKSKWKWNKLSNGNFHGERVLKQDTDKFILAAKDIFDIQTVPNDCPVRVFTMPYFSGIAGRFTYATANWYVAGKKKNNQESSNLN